MSYRLALLSLFSLLLCMSSSWCWGQEEVAIKGVQKKMLTANELGVYRPGHDISVQTALKTQFETPDARIPNLGINTADVWVSFRIRNLSEGNDFMINLANSTFDEVELYTVDTNHVVIDSLRISKKNKFASRPYQDPNYLFDIRIPPGAAQTYYLRINSKMPIILPIYITRPSYQLVEGTKEHLISGAYLGVVIIMFVYNLFLFLSIRDSSYIYYVIYVLGAGLTQLGLKGFNYQFLWPNSPGFENIEVILFASITGVAALLFTLKFLEIQQHFKYIQWILYLFMASFVMALILLPIDINTAFLVMQTATSVSSVGVVLICCYVIYQRPNVASARYFLVAWSVLLIGSLIFILKDYSILPFNKFTNYSVQMASAIEMALLSFGLANRINILKREKDQSRMAALRVAKENSRIIQEQNQVLEVKVSERTEELVHKNQELNQTLDDLQQAQMKLVESEKMASLGQLTAGIAHEINNPINFVTGNIGPLKRDVDVLFRTIDFLEERIDGNVPHQALKQELDVYKEDQDFDYLKIEIGHLLKGISEGAGRTAEIVKSLRIFSRLDEDDLKMADINECLESTLVIANNIVGETTVQKNYGDIPAINCYPGKLNQVFLNIISNALFAIDEKFKGQPGGLLKVSTSVQDDKVCIEIRDNGTGMSEETKHKMFDPFFTTKDVGKGTGLGMSIAFNTIQKHRGEVRVDTRLGEGTAFVLLIPIAFDLDAEPGA